MSNHGEDTATCQNLLQTLYLLHTLILRSMETAYDHSMMDNEVIEFYKRNESRHVIIIAVFIGEKLPEYCIPMVRNPKPRTNIPLDNNLSEIYLSALKENPSIQDGAILVQLDRGVPILRGFSYRLFPPPLKSPRLENMGSGYNSSIDFSGIENVLCVYLINENGVKKFVDGEEKLIKYSRSSAI